MPVIVEFSQKLPGKVRQEFGAYRVVEVAVDRMRVFDAFQPFTLATRSPSGGWIVNGLEDLEFDAFVIPPPRDEGRAELDTPAASD